ncbi:DUF6318 family protein [Geodermatophilus sp. URMC 61]|uniref:DUF6318 family protein n=1 Tax=Geodermatophilus sp. URMC 61 TaxID=3423411 RepID=UPI00406C0C4C
MDDVTRRWTLRLVAGLAAGAVALSGCSEREANDTLPEADASPSTSEPELPPLGPPDLPMPAEARTQDAAGAEAFVRYYIDLINRTSTVMDAAPLREFSNGCAECDRIASDYESDAASGYRYDGGKLTLHQVGKPLISNSTAEVAFRFNLEPLTLVDADGAPVPGLTFAGSEDGLGSAALQWIELSSCWRATQLDL